VRQMVWLMVLLGAWGGSACVLSGPPPARGDARDPLGPWRRTAAGWENSLAWTAPAQRRPPLVHPLIAALCLILGTLGGTRLVKSAHPDAGHARPAACDSQTEDETFLSGRIAPSP
jgi:hypothetical protein